jgi:tRNA uridine 5-carboxymethylaminomethyl modification enzyme
MPVRQPNREFYDVAVVGAGHAGCEAAVASARMGLRTALFTLNLDLIAQMSCNPAIGGVAKGHLVREIDALGGIMGQVADSVGIQFRLLNTSRGPAVWSPRAQCDKAQYRVAMRRQLENEPNLHIRQAEVTGFLFDGTQLAQPRKVCGLHLRDGRKVGSHAVVVTTGTFLNGLIHCGEQQYPAGRSGEPASVLLGESLKALGLRASRLKTGTPPRLDGRPIDWARFLFPHARGQAAADLLPYRPHHGGDARDHPRERASLAHVLRRDRGHRAALLPLDRRQGGPVSR